MRKPLYFVDLFAGCGGLSLGLEQAGFEPLLFCELNASAAETYMANRKEKDVQAVGDIYNLTDVELAIRQVYWRQRDIGEIDLVCGGPPCQGYSGIGHRRSFKVNKEDIPSNHLFKEMIRVIRFLRPRMFLFENVKGILTAKWSPGGDENEIWKHVLNGFSELGDEYHVKWDLLHASDYGVPQNRPRVFVVGVRDDVYRNAELKTYSLPETDGLSMKCALLGEFLPGQTEPPPTIPELLSDLVDDDRKVLEGREFVTRKYPKKCESDIQRELRENPNGKRPTFAKGDFVQDHEYSKHEEKIRKKFEWLINHPGKEKELPEEYKTKKFAQRVLPEEWRDGQPNITATSLPDDYVHYSQPRTLSVREWARLQTFPDWYKFCGPRTTGGRRRAGNPDAGDWDRDVPKYTQIGNAVPVKMARAIGEHFKKILAGGLVKP